jgi:hypothetical protein
MRHSDYLSKNMEAYSMKLSPIVCKWRQVEIVNPDDGTVERVHAHVPVLRYRKVADKQFADGDEFPLIKLQPRDMRSHNAYFACVGDAFDNLPEKIAARFATSEHLRKWALIRTNWCDEKEFSFHGRGAEVQARRLSAFIRTEDEYAEVNVARVDGGEDNREQALDRALDVWTENGSTEERERMRLAIRAALTVLNNGGTWKVIVRKAKSQAVLEMGAEDFKKSKADVLDLLEHLTNVPRGALMRNAGKSA